jgi:hypothetical protein
MFSQLGLDMLQLIQRRCATCSGSGLVMRGRFQVWDVHIYIRCPGPPCSLERREGLCMMFRIMEKGTCCTSVSSACESQLPCSVLLSPTHPDGLCAQRLVARCAEEVPRVRWLLPLARLGRVPVRDGDPREWRAPASAAGPDQRVLQVSRNSERTFQGTCEESMECSACQHAVEVLRDQEDQVTAVPGCVLPSCTPPPAAGCMGVTPPSCCAARWHSCVMGDAADEVMLPTISLRASVQGAPKGTSEASRSHSRDRGRAQARDRRPESLMSAGILLDV